jgi:hypothetical protein
MSGYTKKSFTSVEALRRVSADVLCELLALFQDFCKLHRIVIPASKKADGLDYEAIRLAFMSETVPPELDDILYLATALGNIRGWEAIEAQAAEEGRKFPPYPASYGYIDLAVFAAIADWPSNRFILEKANARARMSRQRTCAMFALQRDVRDKYRAPTDKLLAEARSALARHFVKCELAETQKHGRATEIIPQDDGNSISFLIRYPGKRKRISSCGRTGVFSR